MTTAWERNTDSDEVYKTWLLMDMTVEEYNELGPVDRRTLRTQFNQDRQHQPQSPHGQTQPITPTSSRYEGIPRIPASIGKEPKEEASPKASPSSEEGMQEGLGYVANSPSMRVSSNSVTIDFVEQLRRIANLDTHEVDEKFRTSAEYVFNNWHRKRHKEGKTGVYKNERWLTGIVCNALNLALQVDGGLVALHQGCIGDRSTHSDISVSAINIDDAKQSPPLLVCEGRQDSESTIRETVKGQLFNELVRHRKISAAGSTVQKDFRPVLLMALNTAYLSLDLAFPTTKNGHLSMNEWISPPESNSAASGEVVFKLPLSASTMEGWLWGNSRNFSAFFMLPLRSFAT